MATLSLGYSTCPNDTFIFAGLASGAVAIPGFDLDITLADVEELNRWAASGIKGAEKGAGGEGPDICKVSVAAAASILDDYLILRAGGAMGYGVGPLLVASGPLALAQLEGVRVAVPGRMTTATLLLDLMLAEAGVTIVHEEMIFDQVMGAVTGGACRAGVIIHEGRFTYPDRGLVKLADLGAWWEESRGLPIPLGCIAIRRALGMDTARAVNTAIQQSLAHAQADETRVWAYVREHAQEMADPVMREHIKTFVTDYSMDIGEDGEQAMAAVLGAACAARGRELPEGELFVPAG